MLKSLLHNEGKVNTISDDIRLRSNLTTNKTIRLTKKSFFYTILGFTQSHSGPLGDIESFVQMIPSKYRSGKLTNITGMVFYFQLLRIVKRLLSKAGET